MCDLFIYFFPPSHVFTEQRISYEEDITEHLKERKVNKILMRESEKDRVNGRDWQGGKIREWKMALL